MPFIFNMMDDEYEKQFIHNTSKQKKLVLPVSSNYTKTLTNIIHLQCSQAILLY